MLAQSKQPAPGDGARHKRATILAAAFERFAHYGYRHTAMEDIARVAGISRAAVYLYFKNKDEIFRALSQQLHERALAAGQDACRAHERAPIELRIRQVLDAKLGNFFDVVHGSAHARELLDENNRICGDVSAAFRARYLRLLTQLIRAAVRRGELAPARAGLTPPAAAELLVDSAKCIETGAPLTPAAYRRRLAQLVRVLVAGLGGTTGSAPQRTP